jgi:uncharacterized protein YraI
MSAPTPTATPQIVIEISATVSANRLNIRRGPGPEYTQLLELSSGQSVVLIGRNQEGTWVQLKADDQRWVNARYLRISGDIVVLPVTFTEVGEWEPAGQPTGARARVTTTLRLRGGPGSNYRQLENPDTLRPGAVVDIVGRTNDSTWYQVNVNNRSAWVVAEGVALTGNVNAPIPVTGP